MSTHTAAALAGLGCDIVHIPRLRAALERTPSLAADIFTEAERLGRSLESLAGTYAAKEAIIKALDLTLKDLYRIEIKKDQQGRPYGLLDGERLGVSISISHDGDYAIAVAGTSINSK